MAPQAKRFVTVWVAPITASVLAAAFIAAGSMALAQSGREERDRNRDARIDNLEAAQSKVSEKLERIADDVAFIRGKLAR